MVRKSGFGLLVACLAAVLVVAGCGGGSKPKHRGTTTTSTKTFPSFGPVVLSRSELKARAAQFDHPIYWAGPVNGDQYELTRTNKDWFYVRYLPKGVKAGAKGTKYLIVVTYPYPDALKVLKKAAHGKGVNGPGRSLVYVRPKDPKSVLIAWPKVQYQVEVFNPNPADALSIAKSGQVVPVR